MEKSLVGVLLLSIVAGAALQYEIPIVNLLFTSTGYRVSIPDKNGIYHVTYKIARKSKSELELAAVTSPLNGLWIYENTNGAVKNDEILSINTTVQYGILSYRRYDKYVSDVGGGVDAGEAQAAMRMDVSGSKSCELSETIVRKKFACKGQLIFEDTFDDSYELNSTRWQHDIRMPLDVDDAEFVVFDDRQENCFVRGGLLHIVPSLWNNDKPGTDIRVGELDLGAKCTGILEQECKRNPAGLVQNVLPAVVSARIHTKNSFSFKYGRVEVRARLPQGDWLIPLILLEPLANFYGRNGFASGQLRIAFARGNLYLVDRSGNDISGTTLYGGAVLARGDTLRDMSLWSIKQTAHYGQEFHVFSMTWTKNSLAFAVDGKEYGKIIKGFREIYEPYVAHATTWRGGELLAPFDQEFYLTLGLSVGGHSDFPDGCHTGGPLARHRKPWRNTAPKAAFQFWKDRAFWKPTWDAIEGMQIDYIRVYAL